MNLPSVFERFRSEIDGELKSVLAERRSPLYDMMRYHLGWVDERGNPVEGKSGKALRPTLCLLACEAAGGDYRQALPAAAAIELTHNYSLIHDDIQDDDRERRHRPTVWSIWGKPQAINAGTGMRLLASSVLDRLPERGVSREKQLLAQRVIDESTLELIEGQYLDISFENRFDIGVNNYLEMIGKKTAHLIACSMEVGALIGSDEPGLVRQFRDIGWNLGLAFQIKDDILGIWGDEAMTGKSSASDISRRKKTLPIVYALENSKDGLRDQLMKVYRNGAVQEEAVVSVMQVLTVVSAREQAQRMAERYGGEAMNAIDGLALEPAAKSDLKEMASFIVARDF